MVLFKDINKKADSLINKGWTHDKCFEFENNWKDGALAFRNKATLGACQMPTSGWAVNQEFAHSCKGFSGILKLNTKGTVTAEASITKTAIPGLSVKKTVDLKESGTNASVNVEYVNKDLQDLHFDCNINPVTGKPSLTASVAVSPSNMFRVGADVSGLMTDTFKYNLAGAFTYGNCIVGAKMAATGSNKFTFTEYVHYAPKGCPAEVGVLSSFSMGDSMPKFAAACKYNFNKETSLKVAAADDLQVKALLSHKFHKLGTVEAGAQYKLDASDPCKACSAGVRFVFN